MTTPTRGWADDPGSQLDRTAHTLAGAVTRDRTRRTFYRDEPGPGLFVGRADHPDDYELISKGAVGGEGIVFRGRYRGGLTTALDEYAVKIVAFGDGRSDTAAEQMGRWWDGLQVLKLVNNPHLVTVSDIFTSFAPHRPGEAAPPTGTHYIVMGWVEGPSLAELGQSRQIPWADGLTWVGQLASAVSALHSGTRMRGNPMLHRDIKPLNTVIHPERGLVLVDVGGLRLLTDGVDPTGAHTPDYVAPEALADLTAPRTAASDLFAVGAVAYFVATGENPYDVRHPEAHGEMRRRLVTAATHADVAQPEGFADHLLAMLAPDPFRRPSNVEAWAADLADWGRPRSAAATAVLPPAGPPAPARRSRLPLVLTAMVAVLAVALGVVIWAPWTEATTPTDDASASGASTPSATSSPAPSSTTTSPSSTTSETGTTTAAATTTPAVATTRPTAAWTPLYEGTGLVLPATSDSYIDIDEGVVAITSIDGYDAFRSRYRFSDDLEFRQVASLLAEGAARTPETCVSAMNTAPIAEVIEGELEIGQVFCALSDDGNVGIVVVEDVPTDGSVRLTISAWER